MESIKDSETPTADILHELEIAINDEILAAFQYWTAYQVSCGPGKYDIDPILEEHTAQEWEHVEMLAQRIRELGGSFCMDIRMIPEHANTWYPVAQGDVKYLSNLILAAEDRAVKKYTRLAELTRHSDPVTHNIVVSILKTETEHRYELETLKRTL